MKRDKDASGNGASSWSVDDVIRFVQEADPHTLGPHVELFRKHVSISFKLTSLFFYKNSFYFNSTNSHALKC